MQPKIPQQKESRKISLYFFSFTFGAIYNRSYNNRNKPISPRKNLLKRIELQLSKLTAISAIMPKEINVKMNIGRNDILFKN
ncbi:hypothetical protein ES705_39123 [subsurface metagenome]